MKKRRSFTEGPRRLYVWSVVLWTGVATLLCTLAAEPVWGWLREAVGDGAIRLALHAGGSIVPPFDEVSPVVMAAIWGACLLACVLDCLRTRVRFYDGTWAGPSPVRDSTHGDSLLVTLPSRILREMDSWDGEGACEPGLVVGSINGAEVVRRFINILVFGAPGSGKTRRVFLPTVAEIVESGKASLLVLDPKGELRDYTSSLARERGMEIMDVRLDDPARSMRYDLLGVAREAHEGGDDGLAVAHLRELASILVPMMGSSNSYFSDAARQLLVGLSMWVIESDEVPDSCKHIGTVQALLRPKDGSTAAERVMGIASSLPASDPAVHGLSAITGANTASDNVISTLVTALDDACDERVGRMLYDGEVDFARLGRERGACYISFSTMTGNYGRLTAALVAQALAALRGEAARNGGTLPVPAYLLLEEFGQLDPVRRLISDAGIMRSEGIHLIFCLQDRHQLEAKGYSKAEVDALLGMVDDTVVLRVNDMDVATTLSRRLGAYTVRTRGSSQTKGQRGGSSGTSLQLARRDLVMPSELTEWNADVGLLLIGGEDSYAIACPELSVRFPNHLLGLGDEERNRSIRLAASSFASIRNADSPPVWEGGVASPSPLPAPSQLGFDPLA